jgi:hypothetical protein
MSDDSPCCPSHYPTHAQPQTLALFILLTIHALFHLMCHWMVRFEAAALYIPATTVAPGTYVQVEPKAHRGAPSIEEVRLLPGWTSRTRILALLFSIPSKVSPCSIAVGLRAVGTRHSTRSHMELDLSHNLPSQVTISKITRRLGFTFQRQRYEYIKAGDPELDTIPEDALAGKGADAFRLVALTVNEPVAKCVCCLHCGYCSCRSYCCCCCPPRVNVCPARPDFPSRCSSAMHHIHCVSFWGGRYVTCTGLTGSEIPVRTEKYGQNTLSIRPPSFLELYRSQLLKPVAMFQFFTSALWLLDEYWQYTMFSLFNILMFESMTVFQRLQTLKTLSGMSTKPYPVYVFREKSWIQISSLDLLPGDIVSLKRVHVAPKPAASDPQQNGAAAKKPPPAPVGASDVVPCDCVLLRGSAVANEATLTGESVPQMKDALSHTDNLDRPLDMAGSDRYAPSAHALHVCSP